MQQRTYRKVVRPQNRHAGHAVARAFNESADWSDHQGPEALYGNALRDVFAALHPWRWLKVLTLPLFILMAEAPHLCEVKWHLLSVASYGVVLAAMGAFLGFAIVGYLVNDLVDAKKDAKNQYLKHRPIAARKLSGAMIGALITFAFFSGCACTFYTACTVPTFWMLSGGFLILELAYTFILRRVAGLAPFVVAVLFAVRSCALTMNVVSGGITFSIGCLCGEYVLPAFLIGLFFAFCKQRADAFRREEIGKGRPPQPVVSLAEQHWLDLAVVLSGATLVGVALSQGPIVVGLVLFALLRYLRLAFRERNGSRPNALKDPLCLLSAAGAFLVHMLVSCGIF